MPMFPDWVCCLAIALEEELEVRYERYVLAGGDPKKYPSHLKPKPKVASTPRNPFEMVMGALRGGRMKVGEVRGNVEEVAKVKGAMRVFRREDGTFVDETGTPVTPRPGSVFVPVKK